MFIKTGLTQLRQYKTTLCQIVFPLGLIAILFGFQALVNSLIQDELGPTTPTVYNPRAFALPPYFIQTAEFDPTDNTACPPVYTLTSRPTVTLDAYAGRTMIANPAGWSGLGSFGASLGSIDFWNPNTPLTEEPSGFLGKFPRDVTSYFSLKAAVQVTQGNRVTLCQSRYYYTPILPDTSKTSLDDIQSTIYSSWANSIINGGYVFNNVKLNGTGQIFDYTIVYNYTLTRGGDLGILQNLISSTLFRSQSVFPQSSLKFNSTFDYPSLESANEFDIVSLVFAAFAIFIFQLMFPVVLSYLVYEKEFKLREIMKMSGLKTYVYWIVNYLVFFLIYLIAMEIMHLVGFLFGFKIFVTNDFWTVFFLILTWGNCMLAMAFFFSTLFSNSRTSVVFGYILIFAAGLLSSQLIQNYFSSDDTPYGTIFGISIIPMFSLYRGILALASAVRFDGAGLVITDLTSGFGQELREVYGYLVVESIILFLLAAYCELVVPSGVGIKLHPLFMFQPSYWRNRMAAKKNKTSQLKPTKPEDGEPEDVKEERRDAWDDSKNWPVAALDLRKVYEAGDGAPEKTAVNNLCLTVRRGECFGLLGPNGSGKSTTINMISGFFQPTSGTVRYFGDLDIRSDTDVIHLMTGVCPQDSLIWDALTAAEHLQFYGRLRNLKGKDLDDEVAYRLQQVNLYKVRDKLAGKFSGGMKRRLCVAMSLIGSPKVVLLDEPTTGLDPASRNALWDVVRRSKQESSLLLTTHSMEEAEALCERVGIFVNSRMKSIGTPANLKTRIGKYYKVSVTSAVSTEAKVQQLLMELAPKAELFNAPVPGTRSYQILRESVKLADLFAAFSKWSKDEELKIQDYSISNISLEEVFLQITLKELAKEEEDKKEKRPKNELVDLP